MATSEKRNVKKGMEIDQRRRQKLVLERQKAARKEKVDLARRLCEAESEAPPQVDESQTPQSASQETAQQHADEMTDGEHKAPRRSRRDRKSLDAEEAVWRSQLMLPDWMIAVPEGLASRWLVTARPQGKRCLVCATGGRTTARLKTGKVLQVFGSALPNGGTGGSAGRVGGQDLTVLDCILVEESHTFFVCDVLCWKGHTVTDCSSEFRLFWLQQKLSEDAPQAAVHDPNRNPYPFVALPWYSADTAGLEACYGSVEVPFIRDGLQLLHRESHYEGGLTPLMLLWKDANCSTYLSEVYEGIDPSIQVVCLQVTQTGALLTCDEPPYVIATAPPELAGVVQANKQGLALFKIQGVSISYPDSMAAEEATPAAASISVGSMEFHARAALKRAEADSLSKVLFQQAIRTQPLTIAEIAEAAERMDGA